MKKTVRLNQLKIEKIDLPKGYTIRRSNHSKQDVKAWNFLQSHFRHTLYPKGKFMVVFVEHHGKPVGTSSIILYSKDEAHPQAAIVLEEHRRNGLLRAMVSFRLQYCKDKGIKYVRFATRSWLDDYFKSIGV